jgi:hypothetical protein
MEPMASVGTSCTLKKVEKFSAILFLLHQDWSSFDGTDCINQFPERYFHKCKYYPVIRLVKKKKDLNTITNTLLLLIGGIRYLVTAQVPSPQLSLLTWAAYSLSII